MATFPIEIDGKVVPIEAPTLEDALSAVKVLKNQAPVTAEGMLEQGAASLGTGAAYLAGLPGTVRDLMDTGMQKGLRKGYEFATGDVPNPESESGVERFFAGPSAKVTKALGLDKPGIGSGAQLADLLAKGTSALTGGEGTGRQPKNMAEEYIRTGGEFMPAAAAFGGLGVMPLLMYGAGPAALSETAGQLARKYAPDRPDWMPDWMPSAETAARVAGGFGFQPLTSLARKVVTPNVSTAPRIAATKVFDKENIPYSAGQKTGARRLNYRESEVGGAAYEDLIEKQTEAFNRSALKRIGEKADYATTEVLDRAHTRIGKMFERLAGRNDLIPDNQLIRNIRKARNWYNDRVDPQSANRAPGFDGTIRDILRDAQSGKITGAQYQAYITRMREVSQGATGDVSIAFGKLRNALDDAMERGIAARNPNDLGAWRVARNNYRDLRAIEDTVATGARGEEGVINPTKLRQVTTSQIGKSATATGKYDLAELAKAGKILMKQQTPNSGTAARMWARLGGSAGIGGGTGATIGSFFGGPIGAAIGGAAGTAAGPILSGLKSATLMSKGWQKYLGNQLLGKEPPLLGAKPPGGLMRMLEQEQSGERATKSRRYSGGRNAG